MFSLNSLRFLLLIILSSAGIITSLLMLCPASAHAQGGVPLWTNVFPGGPSGPPSSAIAADTSGNVFVTGYSWNGSNADYATVGYSNAGVPSWINRYDGTGNGVDEPKAIAVDSSGNVFVTGFSSNGSNDDYATIKYSNAGVPIWTNRYDGPASGNDGAIAMAVDSSGNVFVLGGSWNGSNRDFATVKYSNVGLPLWTNRYDEPAGLADHPAAIAVDTSGNVLVTGSSLYSTFPITDSDYLTIKYSSAGDLLWINRYDGPDDAAGNSGDAARSIAMDSEGGVFVTGQSFSGVGQAGEGADYATIAYSSAGVPVWTNRYNGPGNGYDSPAAIAVDINGNVFVTGHSEGGFATIKYSSAGESLWTRRYKAPGINPDYASAIAVDTSGNVFVTGTSYNSVSPYDRDYATVAYSNAGVSLWTNSYNGPANSEDGANAIAVDRSGNVFVTGYSIVGTNYDYVTIKYSSSVSPPRLSFQLLSAQLVLSWTNAGFNLQSAPAVTGPFTNLPAATSPYTNALTGPQLFFRLKGD